MTAIRFTSGLTGKRYTVRLIGVDTPETKHPTKPVQYFGQEASAFTKAALEGKKVMLHKDRSGDTIDRYGRWLRYVLLDGDKFNARLIREGYAHAYRPFPFSKRAEFIRLEEQARQTRNRLMEPPLNIAVSAENIVYVLQTAVDAHKRAEAVRKPQ